MYFYVLFYKRRNMLYKYYFSMIMYFKTNGYPSPLWLNYDCYAVEVPYCAYGMSVGGKSTNYGGIESVMSLSCRPLRVYKVLSWLMPYVQRGNIPRHSGYDWDCTSPPPVTQDRAVIMISPGPIGYMFYDWGLIYDFMSLFMNLWLCYE